MAGEGQERLRRDAARWFARMRGPDAAAHRAAFEVWCAIPAHLDAYQRLESRFEASKVLAASRLETLRWSPPPRRVPRAAPWIAGLALAGCAVLAAAVVLRPPGPTGAERQYASAIGEIRTVALSNGSRLVLDTDSRASSVTKHGVTRVRLERGRARLIAEDDQAVVAQAGTAEVRGEGASLDLALTGPDGTQVTLLRGRAEIRPRIAARLIPARFTRLDTRQPLRLDAEGRSRPAAPAPGEAAWPTGLRTFDRAPLSTVTAIANRYDRRQIRFADPALAKLELTGVFRVTETERLAKALAAAFHLTLTTPANGDFVLARPDA